MINKFLLSLLLPITIVAMESNYSELVEKKINSKALVQRRMAQLRHIEEAKQADICTGVGYCTIGGVSAGTACMAAHAGAVYFVPAFSVISLVSCMAGAGFLTDGCTPTALEESEQTEQ